MDTDQNLRGQGPSNQQIKTRTMIINNKCYSMLGINYLLHMQGTDDGGFNSSILLRIHNIPNAIEIQQLQGSNKRVFEWIQIKFNANRQHES